MMHHDRISTPSSTVSRMRVVALRSCRRYFGPGAGNDILGRLRCLQHFV